MEENKQENVNENINENVNVSENVNENENTNENISENVNQNEVKNTNSKGSKIILVAVAILVIVTIIGAICVFSNKKSNVTFDLKELETKIDNLDMYGKMASQTIDKEILNTIFNINENEVEGVIGKMPLINVHSSMYVVVKATEGNVESVKQKLETYGISYEEQWERYLPAQYEFVKNRKIGIAGNYVYMIIGEKSEEVEKLFK